MTVLLPLVGILWLATGGSFLVVAFAFHLNMRAAVWSSDLTQARRSRNFLLVLAAVVTLLALIVSLGLVVLS